MPRARRPWSEIRDEVRLLLRETVAADSFWSNTDLLTYANQAKDLRDLMLAEQDEGWNTEVFTAPLTSGVSYDLPEGAGEVKAVRLRTTVGGVTRSSAPLERSEGYANGRIVSGSSPSTWWGGRAALPSYRLLESSIELDRPAPNVTGSDLLVIELAGASTRLANDADKLSLRYPDLFETLLIYDIWDLAVGAEEAVSVEKDPTAMTRFSRFHRSYERMFEQWATTRAGGIQRARAWRLGD